MRGSTSEVQVDGEDVDNKEVKEPKKSGRKPKEKVEDTSKRKRRTKKEMQEARAENQAIRDVATKTSEEAQEQADRLNPISDAQDTVIPTSMPSLKDVLKSSVREALATNANIMFSEIATKLGVDEALVSELSDEIDVEG
jgi:hypothetical protein